MTKLHGGIAASIEPGSIAEEAGILPGDLIVSLNGHLLADIIDYRFYSAEEEVEILIKRGDEEAVISVEKDYDDPLGLEFTDELFDGVRTCGNRCVFCFVHQLPKGMRRSLYLKDDDYRLSFLHGNFVTLTKADDSHIRRIIEQRLTPLYVSVHTTEPELRREMLRGKCEPDVMGRLRALVEGGITLHTQIVLCPGWNDGPHFEKTVRDLAALHPGVASIGVVPVGLTEHRKVGPQLDRIGPDHARGIVANVKKWQREFKSTLGTRLVWASDELYLVSGMPTPSARTYEGFPQYENGIGIVRQFLDETKLAIKRLPERVPHLVRSTIVTSTLAAPILNDFAAALNRVENLHVEVVPIRNEFFGESVTVAGLITGRDIAKQLQGREPGDVVIVPSVMLRDGAFLDDVTTDQLSGDLNRPIVVVKPLPRTLMETLACLDLHLQ